MKPRRFLILYWISRWPRRTLAAMKNYHAEQRILRDARHGRREEE